MPTDPTTIPGWNWAPGMRLTLPDDDLRLRILQVDGDGVPSMWTDNQHLYTCSDFPWSDYAADGWTPDDTDPATAGCLMALLGPEAWRLSYQGSGTPTDTRCVWRADVNRGTNWNQTSNHPTLSDACIAVAEAMGKWPGGAA